MSKNYIEHSGILGQKWGRRRYQNTDGTWTEEGKRRRRTGNSKWGSGRYQNSDGTLTEEGKRRRNRYGAMDLSDQAMKDYVKRRNLEKSYNRAMEFEDENPRNLRNVRGLVNDTRSATDAAGNLIRNSNRRASSKQQRLDLSNRTDKELRDEINRELLERQYNQVFNSPQVSKGRYYAEQALSTTGDVLAVAAAGLGVAVGVKKLLEG